MRILNWGSWSKCLKRYLYSGWLESSTSTMRLLEHKCTIAYESLRNIKKLNNDIIYFTCSMRYIHHKISPDPKSL